MASIYNTIKSAASADGSNSYNTLFFIGWDEPGGTDDHIPPGPVPPPDPARQRDSSTSNSTARLPAGAFDLGKPAGSGILEHAKQSGPGS